MIGIYKITDRQNGKSYIGQSVHCGKRFDEHCKGNQYIDQAIQEKGEENFDFRLLISCPKAELSCWEDYFIMVYNTMYPNGYNKKWNCSKDYRDKILNPLLKGNNVKIIAETRPIIQYDSSEEDDIFLSNKDLEALRFAKEAQLNFFVSSRITNADELKDFYRKGNKEAKERIPLLEDEIFLNRSIYVYNGQRKILDVIKNVVKLYNGKCMIWNIQSPYEENDWDNNFLSEKERESKKYYYSNITGIPSYLREGTLFLKNGIMIFPEIDTGQKMQSWKALFNKKVLNQEYFKFLDSNDNFLDINKMTTKKDVKLLDRIFIGSGEPPIIDRNEILKYEQEKIKIYKINRKDKGEWLYKKLTFRKEF